MPDASYWTLDATALARRLGSGPNGLSGEAAAERLRIDGPNRLVARHHRSLAHLLINQFKSPLLLILVFAAAAAAFGGEWLDAVIVLTIVFATIAITASREYTAQTAVAALQARIRTRAVVVRDGQSLAAPVETLVAGDVVVLSAGSLVPADGVLLDATDFFVSEGALTGESFPVEKTVGTTAADAPLRERTNCVFLGSNVRSGTARCLVMHTGARTEFGRMAGRLGAERPETEFDRGMRRFGYLLTTAMLSLVLIVFAVHMMFGRPPIETLLFALALAVGLSPELLPAILTVNLARGAQMMAQAGVIVRRLNAIENLGSINVLCTDKTGTLTEGVVKLAGTFDDAGVPSRAVLESAACNAALETGLSNPLDEAIVAALVPELSSVTKVAEIPFDYVRKRVSVVVDEPGGRRLITKGAFEPVLGACTRVGSDAPLTPEATARLRVLYDQWTGAGIRVLAVADRLVRAQAAYGCHDERELTFRGFLTFIDRPKPDAAHAIADLAALGVAVKLITGDSRLVAQHLAALVGLRADRVLTGRDLLGVSDEALWRIASETDLFVEVDPNQKERIILALKQAGHVVGFLGDGVNDAPAMHAADTSLSVEHAVDVAREAADFVLLEQGLDVIRRGIVEGRRTFANTLKYILITTSANLGNMVSMAATSLFLPFLPLLSGQILLNNFLSDIPAVGLADDRVDPEMVSRPERWNIRFIGRFMVVFGAVSSFFDLVLFVILLAIFHAPPDLFRTSWFVESLLTELVVALVVRTRRPFYQSRPGTVLLLSTVMLVAVAVVTPYVPRASLLGFVPLPGAVVGAICAIVLAYVVSTEIVKRWFYRASIA